MEAGGFGDAGNALRSVGSDRILNRNRVPRPRLRGQLLLGYSIRWLIKGPRGQPIGTAVITSPRQEAEIGPGPESVKGTHEWV